MNPKVLITTFYLFTLLTLSCKQSKKSEEPIKVELLKDNEVSGPNHWKFRSNYYGQAAFNDNYTGLISGNKYVSPSKSLMISRDEILNKESNGAWYQEILNPSIPEGSTLRLRAKIRTENIQGNIFMSIKGLFGNDKYEIIFKPPGVT